MATQRVHKEIRYAEHLKLRIKLRQYTDRLLAEIYEQSTRRYYDTHTEHHIAVMDIRTKGQIRTFAVAYDDYFSYVDIVTIHPIRKNQINNRLESGRWIKM